MRARVHIYVVEIWINRSSVTYVFFLTGHPQWSGYCDTTLNVPTSDWFISRYLTYYSVIISKNLHKYFFNINSNKVLKKLRLQCKTEQYRG